jgi:DNA-binding response OmpR family regulator
MRVMLVEDDDMIAQGLQTALRQNGFAVDWTSDGKNAAAALKSSTFDLVLLDLGLPRLDGIDVLRELRQAGDATPVIILTARDEIQHRIAGLDAGADDYIVKPFDLDEVTARMRSVLRRAAGRGDPSIVHGELRLDPVTRTVQRSGTPVSLSAHEYAVLEALLQRPGAVLSAHNSKTGFTVGTSRSEATLSKSMHGLRRKLGSDVIRTLRGVGYFVPKI